MSKMILNAFTIKCDHCNVEHLVVFDMDVDSLTVGKVMTRHTTPNDTHESVDAELHDMLVNGGATDIHSGVN